MSQAQPRHMSPPKGTMTYDDGAYVPDPTNEWHLPFSVAHPMMARMIAIMLIFAIGSVAGWVYETVFDVIQGHGIVVRAQFLLPWCPIYGIGCAILEMMVGNGFHRRPSPASQLTTYIAVSAITVTACELMASYIIEATSGTFPWDYSAYPLNFEGRVALPFTALFTCGATLMLAVVNPWVHRQVDKDPAMASAFYAMICILLAVELFVQYAGIADSVRDYIVHHTTILLHDHHIDIPVSIQSSSG